MKHLAKTDNGHTATVVALGVSLALTTLGLHAAWGEGMPARAATLGAGAGLVAALLNPGWAEGVAKELRSRPLRCVGVGIALLLLTATVPRLAARLAAVGALWSFWACGYWPRSRRAWAWCWGATVFIAVAIRIAFVLAVPRPFLFPDSDSYLGPVQAWLSGESFRFDGVRTPGFAAFALAVLATTKSYLLYVVLAHGIGVGLALWAGRTIRACSGELAGFLVWVVLGLGSAQIYYEHAILSEACFGWATTVAAVLLVMELEDSEAPVWRAACLGAAVAAGVLIRPVAQLFPLIVLTAALLRRWRASRIAALVLAMLIPIGAWCTYNQAQNGFFGLSRIGNEALFGAAGHLLDPDSPGHELIKAKMRPALEEHAARRPPWNPDFNWLVYSPEGPLRSAGVWDLPPEERQKVIGELGREAALHNPFMFILRAGYQGWLYVVEPNRVYLLPWEQTRDQELGVSHSSASLLEWSEGPAVGLLAGNPWRGVVYDLACSWPTRVISLLPFELFVHPLLALGLLTMARRDPQRRLILVVLSLAAASMIAAVCVLNQVLPRYHLQPLPLLVVGCAVCLSGAGRADSEDPRARRA